MFSLQFKRNIVPHGGEDKAVGKKHAQQQAAGHVASILRKQRGRVNTSMLDFNLVGIHFMLDFA